MTSGPAAPHGSAGTDGPPLRIVIADDQASVREGLVLLLGGLPGIEVVGAARRRAASCPRAGVVTTQAPAPLRVVIADDQASVREGLVLLLGALPDIEVVGAAPDGEQALALVAEHAPDAILLDLHMPVLDGIETTRRLTAEHPKVAIVVLTTYLDERIACALSKYPGSSAHAP